MTLEQRLQEHFAAVRTSADFDARLLNRLTGLSSLARPTTATARADLALAARAHYRAERARLQREWRAGLGWLAVFALLALLVYRALAPAVPGWLSTASRLLGMPVLPGVSYGLLLVAVALAVWLAAYQPRMDSRW